MTTREIVAYSLIGVFLLLAVALLLGVKLRNRRKGVGGIRVRIKE